MMRAFSLFVLLLLWPIVGHAKPPLPLSPPVDMKNPKTGEEGTWIPRWLEREYVLTDHDLDQARSDLKNLEKTLAESRKEVAELKAAVELQKASEDHLVEVIQNQDKLIASCEPKLERRARALWGTSIGLGVALLLATLGAVAW